MLLLLQSYVTYQQFPRAGAEMRPDIAGAYVDDTSADDELLLAWFTYMQRYYKGDR